MDLAKKANYNLQVEWVPPQATANAKKIRISTLEPALRQHKIQFFSGMPYLDLAYQQMEDFTGALGHDDFPDCLAQLYLHYKDGIHPVTAPQMVAWDTLPFCDEEVDDHSDEPVSVHTFCGLPQDY